MKTIRYLTLILTLVLVATGVIQAHEVRPGYLQITQVDAQNYNVLWKVPAKGDRRLGLYVHLPDDCRSSEATTSLVNGAYIERWRVVCKGGLINGTIAIDGLESTRTDVLARVVSGNGYTQTVRLTPSQSEFKVMGTADPADVVRTYFKLGLEHILLGFDHLLFVLALLFLVQGLRRLIATITAFTVAHSLTLAAATFGWLQVPQSPVEAAIALSIMFVSVEIIHRHQGQTGITTRKPWIVAFLFGMLHGLGFAGALREVGLPAHAIPLALAFFNVGVEAGQLLFVAAVFVFFRFANILMGSHGPALGPLSLTRANVTRPVSYLIGTLSAFWFIERTYGFFV